jgi:hypothetical protein
MTFQQTDLPPYTLSLLRFFVRQFDDFSLVFGIGQLTSHDGKFLGVCLQYFGFDFQNGDMTVKFMLHCHLSTIPNLRLAIGNKIVTGRDTSASALLIRVRLKRSGA